MTGRTLHDRSDTELEDALRAAGTALPADSRPPRLHGDVAYVVHDTPVGRLLLAVRADGRLVASTYRPDGAAEDEMLERISRTVSPRVLRDPAALDTVRSALDDYLAGHRHDLAAELRVDLALATPFQQQVLPALARATAYGERTSYGALAGAIGRPRAARAVGAALGANPLCIVLPCHRVVSGTGALTGYAGGLAAKQFLLDLESRAA